MITLHEDKDVKIRELEEAVHGMAILVDGARDALLKVTGFTGGLDSTGFKMELGGIMSDCYQVVREIEGR